MVYPAENPTPDARWPERLIELCDEFRGTPAHDRRDTILADVWLLANAALCRYLRFHSRSYSVDPEDIGDIASEKSLAFVSRVLDGGDGFVAQGPAQLCSYFSTLARNGLVDHVRRFARRGPEPVYGGARRSPEPTDPETLAFRTQYAEALKDAVLALSTRSRTVWFFRVMLDMSSREIARHPEVRMRPTAVDMTLSRARRSIRQAMQKAGFDPQEIPLGTLTLLWERLRPTTMKGEER